MVGRNREADVNLLRKLNIATVFDLMKEQRKKKYGIVVASSEKVDSLHRYDSFQLCGVPFPGENSSCFFWWCLIISLYEKKRD